MDYKAIVENFQCELDYLIDQTHEPTFIGFTTKLYEDGKITDDDLIEMKGYRNGLKVAKECFEKHIAMQEEFEMYERGEL